MNILIPFISIIIMCLIIYIIIELLESTYRKFIRQYEIDYVILQRCGKPTIKLIRYIRKQINKLSKDKVTMQIEPTEDEHYYSYTFKYNIDDTSRIELRKEWIALDDIIAHYNVCPSKIIFIQTIDGVEHECSIGILALSTTTKLSNLILSMIAESEVGKLKLENINMISDHINN